MTISVLVDINSNMTDSTIKRMKSHIKELIKKFPEGNVFVSTVGNDISESNPITSDIFDKEAKELKYQPNQHAALYNAIFIKMEELMDIDIEDPPTIIIDYEPIYHNHELYKKIREYSIKTQSKSNILIILSDGEDDVQGLAKYKDTSEAKHMDESKLLKFIKSNNEQIKIFCLGYKNSKNL